MSKVLPFRPKAVDHDKRLQQRFAETDRLTLLLINDEPVTVHGVEYSLDDVFTDLENSKDLRHHLINLLQATESQEPECVSRLNRFLIAGARELAFRLTAELPVHQHNNKGKQA
ncbi:hypothetical protein [uncultured Endozoicomonas sp.]|uniref:hypothetical protein n=1 Tax=uncultured Endozoicomonas sp. TaxID=432652 RepID=UPI002624F406|nr:hypothetical protein [uncultured Endozoicomonas sp.]